MTLEDVAGDQTAAEVWPDNWQAVSAFIALGTQWRVGPGGPTGLDYTAIPVVLRALRVKRADHSDVFDALRVMEIEALSIMREKHNG